METKKSTSPSETTSDKFRKFFIDQIKDIYWAEKHLVSCLKKMKRAATSEELATAFADHIEQSQNQIASVENIFRLMGKTPQAKKCDAMEGLISEAESVIEDTEKDSYTRDAALILAAQKAEHYEIASYGTLRIFAKLLGEKEVSAELERILHEEEKTDKDLTALARRHINALAVAE